MVFMLLFTLVFGIVEFGLWFKDSLTVTNAVRAGARAGSAATRSQEYNVVVVNAVTTAQTALGSGAPTDLWIYKADEQDRDANRLVGKRQAGLLAWLQLL